MKWLDILFVGLLAGRSLATACDCNDKINDTLIVDVLVQALNTVPVPTFENADNSGYEFAKEFTKLSAALALSLMRSVHGQAEAIGQNLIDSVHNDTCELQRSIELIKKYKWKKICLDDDLNRLTNHSQVFLDLVSGHVMINQSDLPALPILQTKIVSRTQYHSAKEVFGGFRLIMGQNIASFFGYMELVTLAGWRALDEASSTIQTQIRNQILHGPVMDAYRKAVDQVFEQRHFVRENVAKGTWKSFEEVCNSVIKISDDYQSLKNNKNC